MSEMRWTPEQERVIRTRGTNILVSAAAGSGKTAVLVARIMSLIMDPGDLMDIDELLIVTFTKAAAGEMKERIASAIASAREKDPENEHLAAQSALIHNAQITTIDGFCSYVVRNYGHTIGLTPGMRVAEEGEIRLLMQDVLDQMLDRVYEEKGDDPEFVRFVETFATGKDDRPIGDLILRVYRESRSNPVPEKWLEACRASLMIHTGDAGEENPGGGDADPAARGTAPAWMSEFIRDIRDEFQMAYRLSEENLEIALRPDGPGVYEKTARADREFLARVEEAESYSDLWRAREWYAAAKVRLSTARPKKGEREGLREHFKENRGVITKEIKKLCEDILIVRPEDAEKVDRLSAGPLVTLLDLAGRFGREFAGEKRRRGVMDFSDLEHFALAILRNGEDGTRTEAARELAHRFREVMIDEYQDSNYLQEAILTAASRIDDGEKNYFCVGDVKQSIYSFRDARPELFMEKFRSYGEHPELGSRIDLHRNFRSRREVIAAVNDIFGQIMRAEAGGVDYDEAAALQYGADYPEEGGAVTEIMPVTLNGIPGDSGDIGDGTDGGSTSGDGTDGGNAPGAAGQPERSGRTPGAREAEAHAIGDRIRRMAGREKIWDSARQCMRPVEYRDIVILLRTVDGWADPFVRTLEGMGIPAYSNAKSGYFGAMEVQAVLSFLAVLDNPYDDIPFTAVLRSPFCGLSADGLARVRVLPGVRAISGSEEKKYIYMYESARAYAGRGEDREIREKLEQFFELYDSIRAEVNSMPLHELISRILNDSGYLLSVSSMPGGAQRAINLRMLADQAESYEKTGYAGLFQFIRYIRNLQKNSVDFGELSAISENDNVVRILSIHRSKGLEYPVVFVAGLGKRFNRSDQRTEVVIQPEMGIASDYIDCEARVRVPALRKDAIRRRMKRDSMGEELRILYVALTRARQRLILTGIAPKPKEGQDGRDTLLLPLREKKLPAGVITNAQTPLDLLMICAGRSGRRGEKNLAVTPVSVSELTFSDVFAMRSRGEILGEFASADPCAVRDPEAGNVIGERFGYQYPYAGRENVPIEISVSELKHRARENPGDESREADETVELFAPETPQPFVPDFIREMRRNKTGAPAGLPSEAEEMLRGDSGNPETEGGSETGLGASERGTAYHRVMELLDFTAVSRGRQALKDMTEEAAGQIRSFAEKGKIGPDAASAVRPRDIARFLVSDLGQRMTRAALEGRLMREQPFVLRMAASEADPSWPEDEDIFVQGVIDAFFYEGDGVVLVDYKTDRVQSGEELIRRYRIQIADYAAAIARILGRPVKEACIWSFCLGTAVRAELPEDA